MVDLPTIEECQEFHAAINRGRVACGLDALEYIEFDGCEPGSSTRCLSATNLFAPAGFRVCARTVYPFALEPAVAVLDALEMPSETPGSQWSVIPAAIKRVTDAFDACADDSSYTRRRFTFRDWDLDALRERMVQAGVVE